MSHICDPFNRKYADDFEYINAGVTNICQCGRRYRQTRRGKWVRRWFTKGTKYTMWITDDDPDRNYWGVPYGMENSNEEA